MQPYLNWLDLTAVVHVLVTSWLVYSNGLEVGLPLKMVPKLQLAWNVASCVVAGYRQFNSVGSLLLDSVGLHKLLIWFWIQVKVFTKTFQAPYGSGPGT